MTGAGAIVEILKTAGLLREEAGELVATFVDEIEPEDFVVEDGSPPEADEASEPIVSATVEAGEDLAPRLKALLRELSDPSSRG